MRKLLLVIFFFLPLATNAQNVGFVPSGGIWFSDAEFKPGSVIRVYSAVFNNEFYSLNGEVGFYDNEKLIDTVEIENLAKESVSQIRIFWTPGEGIHNLSARFRSATAINEDGGQRKLSLSELNSSAGSAVSIKENQELGSVQVAVKKEGDNLVLTESNQEMSMADSADSESVNSNRALTGDSGGGASDILKQNRDILAEATNVFATITTSISKAGDLYQGTKSAAGKSKEYYGAAKDYAGKAAAILKIAEPAWRKLSNNNEPKRVLIIILGALVLWFIVKRGWQRRYYD